MAFDLFNHAIASADFPTFPSPVELFLPIYRMKWCCIMLNDFLRSETGDGFRGGPTRQSVNRNNSIRPGIRERCW